MEVRTIMTTKLWLLIFLCSTLFICLGGVATAWLPSHSLSLSSPSKYSSGSSSNYGTSRDRSTLFPSLRKTTQVFVSTNEDIQQNDSTGQETKSSSQPVKVQKEFYGEDKQSIDPIVKDYCINGDMDKAIERLSRFQEKSGIHLNAKSFDSYLWTSMNNRRGQDTVSVLDLCEGFGIQCDISMYTMAMR